MTRSSHPHYDCVIRGGTVADGTGAPLREADIGIKSGRIEAVGRGLPSGAEEVDARGLLVTPGFVDIHTHYDGQVTWEDTLAPSSDHGVTTVLTGNCGVGFAPCRPQDREALVTLMEGVEDLPEVVLSTGLPWSWDDFASYMDFLDTRSFNINVAVQVGHAPVRVWAMGERAFDREPATDAESAVMARTVKDAIRSGAIGFSTSRTLNHKGSDGRLTPSFAAAEAELTAIARAVGECGAGVLQLISDFDDPELEMAMLGRVCEAGGRPMSVSLLQRNRTPDMWLDILQWIERLNAGGMSVLAQVSDRLIGALMGLELSENPLARSSAYREIAGVPLGLRVKLLSDSRLRSSILADLEPHRISFDFDRTFSLGNPPNYEPGPEAFLSARASRLGIDPLGLLYDLLLEDDGQAVMARYSSNYAGGSLDVCGRMLRHPHTVMGLGDGGAHLGILCDSSQPTHLLTHWARDRDRDRLPIETAVAKLSGETAAAIGLTDRGVIAPGLRADLNVINFDRLALAPPTVTYDLPAGGRRLRQRAHGYVATIVGGEIISRNGEDTGARPGRLVRGEGARAIR